MAGDIVVRGAHVVDGSGLAGYTADVEVRGGRITRVGKLGAVDPDLREIDADGLVLTPGFVDIHTHYDAQLYFEPTASPSSWHGVTTVVTGNCGFTFAPAGPEDLQWLIKMLGKVEGMSVDSLQAGVEWGGGTFASFLDSLSGRTAVNMCPYVGHASIRRSVMGDAASHRTATAEEIVAMQVLVREAMEAGAFGFSSSQLDVHADHEGNPVPPNNAAPEEIIALASVLADFDQGVVQFAPRSGGMDYSAEDKALMLALARESGGKAVNLSILMSRSQNRDSWRTNLDFLEQAAADGLRLYPMASVNPKGLHFTFVDTFVFDEMPVMRAMMALPLPERMVRLADPDARAQYKAAWDHIGDRVVVGSYDTTRVAAVAKPEHQHHVGRTIAQLAADAGVHPMDCMIDLALAEELRTVFVYDRPDQDNDVLGQLLNHPLSMAGSSDGGAHLTSFCGADYPTRMLTEVVERGSMSFEAAVSKLTHQPAMAHGLWDRGAIRPGAVADLVLLDRSQLAVGPIRFVQDLPAGASRLVWDEEGYVATIVAGDIVIEHGKPTGATPGEVVRSNQT
jgi:N-acyl-D-aspartate/D-glutamate deacylase